MKVFKRYKNKFNKPSHFIHVIHFDLYFSVTFAHTTFPIYLHNLLRLFTLKIHQRNYKLEGMHSEDGLQQPTSIRVNSTNCLSF